MDFARLLTLNKDAASSDVILTGWLESSVTGPEPTTAEALASHLSSFEKWPVHTPSAIPCFLKLLLVLPDETAARLVEAAEAGVLSSIAPGQLFAASSPTSPTRNVIKLSSCYFGVQFVDIQRIDFQNGL